VKRVEVASYPVTIWIAGDHAAAIRHMEDHVQLYPFCVTVTPTTYVHTSDTDPGIVVGLINYPRFPAGPAAIWAKAEQIGAFLCDRLCQQSYTIQAPDKTVWFSHRAEDNTPSRLVSPPPARAKGMGV
jgi:hypothetical protein